VTAIGGAAVAAWAERVRANRDQVERVREVPDGPDFYAPVTALFRADPERTNDPILDRLLALAGPAETWLDIGCGAGRYALPIARRVREVVALDPSAAMLAALHEQQAAFGVANIRAVEGRWPPDTALAATLGRPPFADVALIAHVGYDVEDIESFVDAMERAAHTCVAVLMDRQPASVADPFWPPVHGEERVPLPALPQFLDVLHERGVKPMVERHDREPRTFATLEELAGALRRQLWIADGGEKERRFHAALGDLVVERDGGLQVRDQAPSVVGLVTWAHHPSG
jgi:SAM-dependent methyltransferase